MAPLIVARDQAIPDPIQAARTDSIKLPPAPATPEQAVAYPAFVVPPTPTPTAGALDPTPPWLDPIPRDVAEVDDAASGAVTLVRAECRPPPPAPSPPAPSPPPLVVSPPLPRPTGPEANAPEPIDEEPTLHRRSTPAAPARATGALGTKGLRLVLMAVAGALLALVIWFWARSG